MVGVKGPLKPGRLPALAVSRSNGSGQGPLVGRSALVAQLGGGRVSRHLRALLQRYER